MRRLIASAFALAACFFLYQFGVWGAFTAGIDARDYAGSVPFQLLGQNYPFDAAMLAAAAWSLGLCLYFTLTIDPRKALPAHVPSTSLWAQRLQGPSTAPMSSVFLINALLLGTMIFMSYVGARAPGEHVHAVGLLAAVAGLHVAAGLVLLALSLFESPRGVARLSLGGAVYAVGTALAVVAFILGQPTA